MVPTETERLALMHRLIDVLGNEEAATLMNSLPPYDWPEIATKADLAAAEARITALFETRIAQLTRTLTLMIVGSAISMWLALLVSTVVA